MNDLPPRGNGGEFHTQPTNRPDRPFFVLAPFVWLWRLIEWVYWQVRGWPTDGREYPTK